jgi:hypothetical protein
MPASVDNYLVPVRHVIFIKSPRDDSKTSDCIALLKLYFYCDRFSGGESGRCQVSRNPSPAARGVAVSSASRPPSHVRQRTSPATPTPSSSCNASLLRPDLQPPPTSSTLRPLPPFQTSLPLSSSTYLSTTPYCPSGQQSTSQAVTSATLCYPAVPPPAFGHRDNGLYRHQQALLSAAAYRMFLPPSLPGFPPPPAPPLLPLQSVGAAGGPHVVQPPSRMTPTPLPPTVPPPAATPAVPPPSLMGLPSATPDGASVDCRLPHQLSASKSEMGCFLVVQVFNKIVFAARARERRLNESLTSVQQQDCLAPCSAS